MRQVAHPTLTLPFLWSASRDDGTFEIKDVPAGKHKLLAWHPFAGRVEIDVDVPEGAAVQTKLEVKK